MKALSLASTAPNFVVPVRYVARGGNVALPELAGCHTVHAYVVHLPGRGVGVQFVGASEAFSADLDRYLAHLAGEPGRTAS